MPTTLWIYGQLIAGIVLLAWAADRFIVGAVGVARCLGWSPVLTGVLLVGFGTSFPEVVVSFLAAYKGEGAIAVGNAIGSNLANIGLVLGITLLFFRLPVHRVYRRRDMPLLLCATAIVGVVFYLGYLNRWTGVLLLVCSLLYFLFMWQTERCASRRQAYEAELQTFGGPVMPLSSALRWWGFGLLLMFASSELLIRGATALALQWHWSHWLVGLTVVAIGTSLPELAATLMSGWKGEYDIALGNVIGSSVYNLLVVLAGPAFLSPLSIPHMVRARDFTAMCLIEVLLMVFLIVCRRALTWWVGVILLVSYASYFYGVIA